MNLPSKAGAVRDWARDAEDLIDQLNDAVYLTDQAAKNRKDDVRIAAPRIRVQPERVKRDPAATTDRGLVSRWFRKRKAVRSNDDPAYRPTRIERPGATDTGTAAKPPIRRWFPLRGGVASKAGPAAQPVWKPARFNKIDRGDVTVAALGITLGLTCALFPWYIFFNQEQFGVREMVFDGSRTGTSAAQAASGPLLVAQSIRADEAPRMNLDFFPTATVPANDARMPSIPPANQPFPPDLIAFKLVHVANGRAMIEDDDGLWVVQRGSRLPDASRVSSIEKRSGHWVLVTSLDKVIELQP